jgi:hypothetical protein
MLSPFKTWRIKSNLNKEEEEEKEQKRDKECKI